MDLKPVELQIAVPRTSEAGRLQQEQQFRPTADQQLLAAQQIKDSELQRIRSSEVDDSPKSELQDREHSNSSGQRMHGDRKQADQEETEGTEPHPAEHPYKGKHIDFSF